MSKYRPLTIDERYLSQFKSSLTNQKRFGKYFYDGLPDTTVTLAEINSVPENSTIHSVIFKNKRVLIVGGIILTVLLSTVVYVNWKKQDEKK